MSRPHSRGVLLPQLRLRAGLAAEGVRGARGIEGSGVASKSSLSHEIQFAQKSLQCSPNENRQSSRRRIHLRCKEFELYAGWLFL